MSDDADTPPAPVYLWVWFVPSHGSESVRPSKAHAFRDGTAPRSVCGYAELARADTKTDITLKLKPRYCLFCRHALRRLGVTAGYLVVTDEAGASGPTPTIAPCPSP